MSVLVPDGIPFEQALKMLWREAIRENIPSIVQQGKYRRKPAAVRYEKTKEWGKMKRRRRSAKRRLRKKRGALKVLYTSS